MGKILFLTLSLILISGARAQATCIDIAEVNEVKTFTELPEDFNEADLCNPSKKSYKLMETILFMKNNTFSGAGVPAPLNQNIIPQNFWGFFAKNLQKISNRADSFTCSNVIAFVITGYLDGEIHLCPEFYSDDSRMIERVSVLMHEARHLVAPFYTHSKCLTGRSKGRKACDESLSDQGSYAVSVEALAKMIVSPAVSAEDRTYGKILLLEHINAHFNTPIDVEKSTMTAVYLESSQGEGLIYDGLATYKIPKLDGPVMSRYFSLVVVPKAGEPGEALTVDTFSSTPANIPVDTVTLKNYNSAAISERPSILAVLNLDNFSSQINSNGLAVNSLPSFHFDFVATQVYTAEELGQDNLDSVFIRDEKKNLYQATWLKEAISLSPAQAAWPFPFEPKATSILQNQRLALNEKGEALVYKNNAWQIFEPLKGKTYTTMTRQFLWNSSLFNLGN